MIILHCIKESSKLRIKFCLYIDSDNKTFTNVYNSTFNCQFPKDIRQENRFYEISDADLCLVNDNSRAPFYKVNRKNIKIVSDEEAKKYKNQILGLNIDDMKIYTVTECVICMSEETQVIFIPCAHKCVCSACYDILKKSKNDCPLCRQHIKHFI